MLLKNVLIRDAKSAGVDLYEWASRLEWVTGKLYLAVRCRACGLEFAFSREDKLDERFYFTNTGKIVLGCPDCKMPMAYSGDCIIQVEAC